MSPPVRKVVQAYSLFQYMLLHVRYLMHYLGISCEQGYTYIRVL